MSLTAPAQRVPTRRSRRVVWAGAVAALAIAAAVAFFVRSKERSAAPSDVASSGASSESSASSASPVGSIAVAVVALDAAPPPDPNAPTMGTFGWGSGKGQVGRSRPEEGNPEAPMSLALDANGQAVVLDQINGRLLRVGKDGKPLGETRIGLRAAQDVAVGPDGSAAVLDRLGDKQIAIVAPNGKYVGSLPLEGKGIDETGSVTGVFVDGKDVYVEREHGTVIRIGDTSGQPDTDRPEMEGRPTRDGKRLLIAGITDAATGRLFVSETDRTTMTHLFTRELRMGVTVGTIMLLDADMAGVIYLAVTVELPASDPSAEPLPALYLTCLAGADGHPINTVQLPPNTSADETFRELAVQNEGGVVYAHRTEAGMTLERYDCR